VRTLNNRLPGELSVWRIWPLARIVALSLGADKNKSKGKTQIAKRKSKKPRRTFLDNSGACWRFAF
jgi:hypothetical protein